MEIDLFRFCLEMMKYFGVTNQKLMNTICFQMLMMRFCLVVPNQGVPGVTKGTETKRTGYMKKFTYICRNNLKQLNHEPNR